MAVLFKRGSQVRMIQPPHRQGTVVQVSRNGPYATIWVNFPGWHLASFPPGGLELL